ncbi:hypothetical protein D3C71_1275980 [compost metagenome]
MADRLVGQHLPEPRLVGDGASVDPDGRAAVVEAFRTPIRRINFCRCWEVLRTAHHHHVRSVVAPLRRELALQLQRAVETQPGPGIPTREADVRVRELERAAVLRRRFDLLRAEGNPGLGFRNVDPIETLPLQVSLKCG